VISSRKTEYHISNFFFSYSKGNGAASGVEFR